ncbi:hypothetical protein SAMN05216436_103215 [bacterium A37T11]|nr:hypothetical protein SAMN05216436_103215 [bacterium A37T11]
MRRNKKYRAAYQQDGEAIITEPFFKFISGGVQLVFDGLLG